MQPNTRKITVSRDPPVEAPTGDSNRQNLVPPTGSNDQTMPARPPDLYSERADHKRRRGFPE